MDGKAKPMLIFLIEVGLNNTSVAAYADRRIRSGNFEFNLYMPEQIYNNTSDFDLNDKNIQVLLAIHFLSINDQMFRSKL